MIENREPADHERDFVAAEFFDKVVAVGVLAIKNGELAPLAARCAHPQKFADDPVRFVMFVFQFDDADFLAFLLVGAEHFLREVRAYGVLPDDLRGYAQDVRRGAVILDQRNAKLCRVLPFAPAGKALEKKFEAAERRAAEAVNGLVIVADGDDVLSVPCQQFEEPKLRDVGVLKFIDEDVAIFFLKRAPQLGVGFEKLDGAGDERAERNALFFTHQFVAGAVRAGDLSLQRDFFGALFENVFIEAAAVDFKLGGKSLGVAKIVVAGNKFVLAARKKINEVV